MLQRPLEQAQSKDDSPYGWQHEPARYRFHGLFKGRVEQRTDPMRLGRLRVRVVGIHDDTIAVDQLPWASPRYPAWTKGGMFFIPPRNEYVWVQFEDGHTEYPVWDGGWWAHKDVQKIQTSDGEEQAKNIWYPTSNFGGKKRENDVLAMESFNDVKEEDQPNNFTLVSPLQKHMEFDDRKDREKIKLADQLDNYLWINTEEGVITLEAARGLKGDAKVGKIRGLTLNTPDEVMQLYTFNRWQMTFSDKDAFTEINSPAGYKVRISEADKRIEVWTKDGQHMIFDDAEERILVKSKGGRYLQIDDKAKVIRLSTGTGCQITMDETSRKHVFKVTGELQIESTTGLKLLCSGGKLEMQGTQVHMNSQEITNASVVELQAGYEAPENPPLAVRAPLATVTES